MEWLLDLSFVVLFVSALSFAFIIALVLGIGVRYQIAFDKLPAACHLQELEAILGGREARLQEVNEQLRQKEPALVDREKAELDTEFWRTAVETTKAEYDALSDQRREIEEVRENYRQAAEELTVAEGRLQEQKASEEESRRRVELAEDRLVEITAEEKKLDEQQSELREIVEGLEERLSALKNERSEFSIEVERMRDRYQVLRADNEDLEASIARLKSENDEVEAALDEARSEIENLDPMKSEVIEVKGQLAVLTKRRDELDRSVDEKEAIEGRLFARVERLKEELGELEGTVPSDSSKYDSQVLADLTKSPACLALEVLLDPLKAEEESKALRRVMDHLQESGLKFSERTVNAFHTCLKTAVISPLTVLAGISGTGKSQLPRYYADAIGIHFLKIPVQPRWDSPQDLFGFYNYIEKRYKATDLARALVHLDRYNWEKLSKDYQDRMLIVLLDEMNLARVEYYFSEFLSRLEGRPFDENQMSVDDRRPSEIDIDVSQGGQGKRVYAGQNVLFVGTMNEDESTQALSDKVLDRANVLHFPKPTKLEEALPAADKQYVADGYLPKSLWSKKWIRSAKDLDKVQSDRASNLIAQINEAMNKLGRPFGHRMGQAMLHYVANYPSASGDFHNSNQEVNSALADQIEQRILPRLRGVHAEEQSGPLRDLADIAKNELQDGALGQEIEGTVTRSRDSNGLFVWRGLTRST